MFGVCPLFIFELLFSVWIQTLKFNETDGLLPVVAFLKAVLNKLFILSPFRYIYEICPMDLVHQ